MKRRPTSSVPLPPGQRGPAEHERRDQIIQAADRYFKKYGYAKTSVAELAKAIGVSSAYIYRFFDAKRAIGEAVCRATLTQIDAEMWAAARGPGTATEQLRAVIQALKRQGLKLFFTERKLHDIVVIAIRDHWPSIPAHREEMLAIVKSVISAGRKSGEFERKTPLDEVSLAVFESLMPFAHPVLLELRTPEELDVSATAVTNLVLRSLAP